MHALMTVSMFTGVFNGFALINALVASGSSSFQFNEPAGMTTVINTGPITASVSGAGSFTLNGGGAPNFTFSNFSPASASSVGEWAGNLQNTPLDSGSSLASGLRFYYAQNLHGGNSPVRIGGSFSLHGSGTLYARCRVRYSPSWSYSQASGNKFFRIQPLDELGENNFFANFGRIGNTAPNGTDIWFTGLIQHTGDGSNFGVIPGTSTGAGCNSPTGSAVGDADIAPIGNLGGSALGQWHWIEYLSVAEVPSGIGSTSPGEMTYWVDTQQSWTSVGKTLGTLGTPSQGLIFFTTASATPPTGYYFFIFDPTYGGDLDSDRPPNANVYWDVDQIYVSVK